MAIGCDRPAASTRIEVGCRAISGHRPIGIDTQAFGELVPEHHGEPRNPTKRGITRPALCIPRPMPWRGPENPVPSGTPWRSRWTDRTLSST
jgi:hypothetical protein